MLIIVTLIPYALFYGLGMLMRGWRSLGVYALLGIIFITWNYIQLSSAAPDSNIGVLSNTIFQSMVWTSALGLLAGVSIKVILLQKPDMKKQNRITLMICGLFLPVLIGAAIAVLG